MDATRRRLGVREGTRGTPVRAAGTQASHGEDAGGAHSPGRACSEPLHTGACRPGRAGGLEECTAALLKVNHRVQLPFPREPGGGRERGGETCERARERRRGARGKVLARRSKQTNRRWNKSAGGWSPPGSSQSREPSAPRAPSASPGTAGDRGRRRGLRRLRLSSSVDKPSDYFDKEQSPGTGLALCTFLLFWGGGDPSLYVKTLPSPL